MGPTESQTVCATPPNCPLGKTVAPGAGSRATSYRHILYHPYSTTHTAMHMPLLQVEGLQHRSTIYQLSALVTSGCSTRVSKQAATPAQFKLSRSDKHHKVALESHYNLSLHRDTQGQWALSARIEAPPSPAHAVHST